VSAIASLRRNTYAGQEPATGVYTSFTIITHGLQACQSREPIAVVRAKGNPMAVNSTTANAAPQIAGAIRQAARSSGISFEYLITTAQIESNLNPAAQAATSSAKGLYQFIDQTWLGTLKTTGRPTAMANMPTPFRARRTDTTTSPIDHAGRDHAVA